MPSNWKSIDTATVADGLVRLLYPNVIAVYRESASDVEYPKEMPEKHRSLAEYSRTSMARTPLVLGKYVRGRGCSR